MAFKIAQKKTITWPVTVSIPQDGGKVVKSTFTGEFLHLSKDEIDALNAEGRDLLDAVLTGWKGVTTEDNSELEFNDETKKNFLGVTYVRAGLFSAYAELQNGREAARKN